MRFESFHSASPSPSRPAPLCSFTICYTLQCSAQVLVIIKLQNMNLKMLQNLLIKHKSLKLNSVGLIKKLLESAIESINNP